MRRRRGREQQTEIEMPTLEEYENFLSDVRESTGLDMLECDDGGLVSVSVDGRYTLNLQYVEATGKILCFVEVATLPPDAPAEVYRDLLAGGLFGRDTAGGYFAFEPESGIVVYNYIFDLESSVRDVDGFVQLLENILKLCDLWSERIAEKLSAGESGGDAAPPPDFGQMIMA